MDPGRDPALEPAASSAIDYEAELTVVIGKGGKGIAAGAKAGKLIK